MLNRGKSKPRVELKSSGDRLNPSPHHTRNTILGGCGCKRCKSCFECLLPDCEWSVLDGYTMKQEGSR
jgi:hypothetical protein